MVETKDFMQIFGFDSRARKTFFLVPGLMLFDRERFLELVCLIFGLVLLMDLMMQ